MTSNDTFQRLESELIEAASLSVRFGLREILRRRDEPEEPDYVAGLVCESSRLLGAAWNEILMSHGVAVSVLGVFCHGSPMVAFQGIDATHREIGDLLIAHVHHGEGPKSRRAILLQAKMCDGEPTNLKDDGDKEQLHLYVRWPEFTYTQPSRVEGEKRKIVYTPHAGARYLLIDDLSSSRNSRLRPRRDPVRVAPPAEGLKSRWSLEEAMYGLFLQQAGRPFRGKNTPHQSGWDKVVWDLLHLATNKAFNRRGAGYQDRSRYTESGVPVDGATVSAGSVHKTTTSTVRAIHGPDGQSLYNPNSEPPEEPVDQEADEPAGPSVILIETSTAFE